MAGRRWFARDALTSMGWWCFIILAIGGCRRVLAADSAAMEPISTVALGEEGGCYRPLSDVIWGFLATLLALTVSFWGSWKHKVGGKAKAGDAILMGLCSPLMDLALIVENSLDCVSILWVAYKAEYRILRKTTYSWFKFLCSSLFPWSKSPARIVASCDVLVYVPKESPILQEEWLWSPTCDVKDESEALVVGENGKRAIRNDRYERRQLSEKGVGLWVWKEVFYKGQAPKRLPKYDELKYLRGNSGFAILAIAVQALGYIYAVGFQAAKNLRISPLEVIGLILNIISLIKILFYSTCNPCHRPLVIYIDGDWEHEVGKFIDNNHKNFEQYNTRLAVIVILFGISISLNTLLIYCMVHMLKATNVMVVLPVILFLIGEGLHLLGYLILLVNLHIEHMIGIYIENVGHIMNGVAYIWALVGTVLYWRTMHFNTRPELINLSEIIPFIG